MYLYRASRSTVNTKSPIPDNLRDSFPVDLVSFSGVSLWPLPCCSDCYVICMFVKDM